MNKQLTYLPLLVASTAVLTACGNDEVLDSADLATIEATETQVTEDANEDVVGVNDYAYVMSHFASLNQDGSLRERTHYTEQLDEADSTAIYTSADDRTAARETFLSLLPSELRSNVIASQDSSEMSYAIENDIRTLTYREAGDDSDTLAYVLLPARADYQDIATSLTIVRSQPAVTSADSKYKIGGYYSVPVKLIFANNNPYHADDPTYFANNGEEISFDVREFRVNSLCFGYGYDEKTKKRWAKFVFIPPVPQYTTFRAPDGAFLVSMLAPRVFYNDPKMENKTDTHYNEQFTVGDGVINALPLMTEIEDYINATGHDYTYINKIFNNSPDLYKEGEETTNKDLLMNYDIRDTAQINKFFHGHWRTLNRMTKSGLISSPDRIYHMSLAFAYKGEDNLSDIVSESDQYFCCPPYLRWGKSFYRYESQYNDVINYSPENFIRSDIWHYACSFISSCIGADVDKKGNLADFCMYYEAKDIRFEWNGRNLQNTMKAPLRVLYFADMDM